MVGMCFIIVHFISSFDESCCISHGVLWSLMLLQYSIEFSHPVCGEAIGII